MNAPHNAPYPAHLRAIFRILDANCNRLKEGLRVVEDIARFFLNDESLAKSLKNLRHRARFAAGCESSAFSSALLSSRDIKNDCAKATTKSESNRKNLRDIVVANLKRAQESARVLEEITKIAGAFGANLEGEGGGGGAFDSAVGSAKDGAMKCDWAGVSESFKALRYELYDIEISYFRALEEFLRKD